MNLHNTSMMNNFPYLYRGTVLYNDDPKHLGRCKILIPSIHGSNAPHNCLPWARCVSTLPVNSIRGSSCVPDVGDIVWVLFEGGERDYPVYIGGTQGTPDIPVEKDKVILYQEEDSKILYDRERKSIEFNVGENYLTLSLDGINIKTENLNMACNSNLGIQTYQYVNISPSSNTEPEELSYIIDVVTLKTGDSVRVLYEGLELVSDIDYTIDFSANSITLHQFKRMSGERLVVVVSRVTSLEE